MTTQPFRDPYLKGRPGEAARQAANQILSGPHLSVLSTTQSGRLSPGFGDLGEARWRRCPFSTVKGRRKTANMQRDPRVNLLVHSLPAGGEEITYATLSGTAELTDDPEDAFHQVMYDLHMGGATPPPEPGAERLIVRLRPNHIYPPPSHVVTAE